MSNQRKTFLITAVIFAVIIALLLLLRAWQIFQQSRSNQQLRELQEQLAADRQAADLLLLRLEATQQLRDELAMPQMQLNIKL